MERRILIVEDETEFARFLKRACEEELPFIRADFAENGWEALKLVWENPKAYSLIATDIDMSPINGDDLIVMLEILRKYKLIHAKILSFSGKVTPRPVDFIEKPFTPEEFCAKISQMLENGDA